MVEFIEKVLQNKKNDYGGYEFKVEQVEKPEGEKDLKKSSDPTQKRIWLRADIQAKDWLTEKDIGAESHAT